MTVYRLYTDGAGESRLATVSLPELDTSGTSVSGVRGLSGIRATSVSVVEMSERLLGAEGLHAAPARQVLVLLRGAYEVTTPAGERCVLGPGDVLFTDDVDGRGHETRDVGEERVSMVNVQVDPDWPFPADGSTD